jgi:triosephosphate isomerase
MAFTAPVVIGNWKMNGLRGEAEALVRGLLERVPDPEPGTLGVCPPFPVLTSVAALLEGSRVLLGGQDCSPEPKGAFTGDTSAPMLKDAGCQLAIVGHSERRHGHGESDALIKAKAEAALAAGLVAIVCIGETEAEWQAGKTLAILDGQLAGSLPDGTTASTMILAYEPVWAIGTGRTPTIEDIERTHGHIRHRLQERFTDGGEITILYGGSVKGANAESILGVANVDGVLVGGASLQAEEFATIFRGGQAAHA